MREGIFMLSCFIKNAKICRPNECANQNENVVKSIAMQPYQDHLYILKGPVARMFAVNLASYCQGRSNCCTASEHVGNSPWILYSVVRYRV